MPPVELWIGLDFGTSCSKIVIRPPYEADRRAFVVPAPPHVRADGDCLWATRVAVDPKGRFLLGDVAGVVPLTGIKEALMREPRDSANKDPREPACAYLALLLRESVAWFENTHGARFGGRARRWSCNVGFPAASYDNEILCARYRRVVAAAWKLAESGRDIEIASVRWALDLPEAVGAAVSREQLQHAGADIIPEVVAEAHGFAQSPMRDDGLFLLLDVGAGTLDVCTFVLHREREGRDRYSILDANVELLGAEHYKQRAGSATEREEFAYEVETAITKTIWRTKTTRDPHSLRWRSRLPFLICGGGVRAAVYQTVLQELERWFARFIPDCRLEKIEITSPTGLQPAGRLDYRRLAVAYGLSYPGFDIGGIELPRMIDNVPRRLVRAGHDRDDDR